MQQSLAGYLHDVVATRFRNWRLPIWRDSELSRVAGALTPADVVVGIEVQPYAIDTIALAWCARDVGTRVIAITDRPQSPLADCANDVLLVPAGSPSVP